MAVLPIVGWEEVVRVLSRIGYEPRRQKGSHLILVRLTPWVSSITVPRHKEIAPGTLRSIIRQSGLSVEQFNQILAT